LNRLSAFPEAFGRLSRDELPLDTIALARFLVGVTLVHDTGGRRLSGRIVETEAYLPDDAASHSYRGETRRNRSMFRERGIAYVYIAYGVWPAFNISSGESGVGAAVLVRALQPLEGVEEMRRNRATDRLFDLARGPGRLTAAMEITLAHDGIDLCARGPLWLSARTRPADEIVTATRIGITKEANRLLRFFEHGNPFVSGPRRLINGPRRLIDG
jgi:DNA-3-methyladenine glycosylase